MSKVYLILKQEYDDTTVVGCYLDKALAESERVRLEALAEAHRSGLSARHRTGQRSELMDRVKLTRAEGSASAASTAPAGKGEG